MNESSHHLSRPLPPDVAAGESAFIQFYQAYAAFSWPWAWRRTVVFGSIAALIGISFGITHGLWAHVAWEGALVSLACAVAGIVLVGAGPMLAAFIRHRGWPLRTEQALVIVAVLCGMVLAELADGGATRIHDHFMTVHGDPPSPPEHVVMDAHMFIRHAMEVSGELLVLLVASGGLALPGYFSERRRWAQHRRRVELEKLSLQKGEADLRLTLLQAQVEPHFLFNTLASVRSLVGTDPRRAAQTIDALAQHLRTTLPKLRAETGATQSTLGEQFAICASYLDLMKIRLGDRLSVEISLPLELQDAPFPPLLLISLVENAIKHGVEPKPGAARVLVAARLIEPRRLEVRVEDDGTGLKLGMGEGTGLANIRAQLQTRFGTEASLELTERSEGGVVARLLLPLETRP